MVALSIIPMLSFGQITLSDSAHHTVITAYAGILAGPKVLTRDAKTTAFYALRVGGTITYSPAKWLSVFGLGAGETAQTDTTTPFALFGIKVFPCKGITVTMGKIASPMTELRPLPTTSGGQFEPWTLAQIPGSALGGKITFSPSKSFSIVGGGFYRGGNTSIELGMGFSHVQIAGYYMNKTKIFGGAVQMSFRYLSTTIMYNGDQNAGMLNVIEIPKTHGLSLYSDVGFNANNQKMIRGEWGLFTTFSIRYVKALIGAGYCEETKSVKGYVFMHI